MCEVYGFCGNTPITLNKYTNEFWKHAKIHQDGFGYYLADKDQLYVNPKSAIEFLQGLAKFDFKSKLALCHIRFKTHGNATKENCHPFSKYDCRGTKWTLVHNGYICDNGNTAALSTIQDGETDSERMLLSIIEAINHFYEHSFIENENEFKLFLYACIERELQDLSQLGKTNFIFTDSLYNNMYVFMNHPNTLYSLKTDDGFHISTTKLTDENWMPVEPYKLHIFNNGEKLDY